MTPYPRSLERFPTLRQSTLANFDRCALSAKFDLDHRSGWSGHPQARGTIFHTFAAKCLRVMSEEKEKTIPTDLAVEILQETLRQADADTECIECKAPLVARDGFKVVCEEGHKHTGDFMNIPMSEIADLRWVAVKWAHDNAFDIENLVDIEQRLKVSIRYPAGDGTYVERILTGQLDALFVTGDADEEAIVLDWKDTWDLPAATEVGFDGYFQQRFYAFLILRTYPSIERVTLREFYVRFSEPREATVTREQLEDIEAELAALAERFDRSFHEDIYPPAPGRHCSFCPRPASCPIFPSARVEGKIMSADDALKVGREATVAAAALEQRKKALKAWAGAHGPVPVSSHKGPRVWGHRARKRVDRPSKEKMEALIEMNGGQPLSAAQLNGLYRESTSTRFEQFNPSPDEQNAGTDATLLKQLQDSLDHQPGKPKAA